MGAVNVEKGSHYYHVQTHNRRKPSACQECLKAFHAKAREITPIPFPADVLRGRVTVPPKLSDLFVEARIARERYLQLLAEEVFDHDGPFVTEE